MSEHRAEPVGGPLVFNRFTKFLVMFLGLWVLILLYRFLTGIGTVSGLTDGYPWGIWIAFDVVTGTAVTRSRSSPTFSTRANTTRWCGLHC
jgi:Ni/Fe-hydrogenase subunit HybB-like protein